MHPLPALQVIKANGPLAITIWADSNPNLQYYKAGVYSEPGSAPGSEDHAVTLVGWGEEKLANGSVAPYWIILNSWGPTWCVLGGRWRRYIMDAMQPRSRRRSS